MGGKKMIRFIVTVAVLWVLLAFTWTPFTTYVEQTQAVDKTKNIVYTIINKLKKEKVDE
jgi:hypothetical protein